VADKRRRLGRKKSLEICRRMISPVRELDIVISGTGEGGLDVLLGSVVIGHIDWISPFPEHIRPVFARHFIGELANNIDYHEVCLEAIDILSTHWVKNGTLKKEVK
jgi:hypothetical protein